VDVMALRDDCLKCPQTSSSPGNVLLSGSLPVILACDNFDKRVGTAARDFPGMSP
jgi:hypothetical protein